MRACVATALIRELAGGEPLDHRLLTLACLPATTTVSHAQAASSERLNLASIKWAVM